MLERVVCTISTDEKKYWRYLLHLRLEVKCTDDRDKVGEARLIKSLEDVEERGLRPLNLCPPNEDPQEAMWRDWNYGGVLRPKQERLKLFEPRKDSGTAYGLPSPLEAAGPDLIKYFVLFQARPLQLGKMCNLLKAMSPKLVQLIS